jgi:hypothetical protein
MANAKVILDIDGDMLMIKRIAVIRKDTIRDCPFSLPVPVGCLYAGDAVDRMEATDDVPEYKKDPIRKANRRIYRHHKTSQRCPYADKIAVQHKAVHCDRGESGERLQDFAFRPSPFYPRVFSGLGQTGLFAYPVDSYWDNPGARSLFSGVYSIYASTGEIHIRKDNLTPDSILLGLTENIAIKEE